MSEVKEQILLALKLDVDALEANAKKASNALNVLNAEQKDLKKQLEEMRAAGKEGTASFDALQTKIIQNKTASALLKDELRETEKQLKLNAVATRAEEGSLNQLKASLSTLTAQYNALSEDQRKNSETGQQLQKDIAGITNELNSSEQAVGNFKRQVGDYAQATKSLKAEIKEAKDEATKLATQFGENSRQATEATKRVADLVEKQADFNKRVAAFNPEAKFAAFTQAAASLAGGLSAAQGAMALFGGESEEASKALLKVQAAMAITTGLNQLAELGDALKNLRLILFGVTAAKQADTLAEEENIAVTQTGAASQVELAGATEGATFATMGLNTALLATPLGLVAAGILAIVSALEIYDALTKKVGENTEALIEFSDREVASAQHASDIRNKALKDFQDGNQLKLDLLKSEGKGEEDLLAFKQKALEKEEELRDNAVNANINSQNVLSTVIERINAKLATDVGEKEAEKLNAQKEAAVKQIELLQKTNDQIASEQIKANNDLLIEQNNFDEKKKQIAEQAKTIRLGLIKDDRTREIELERESLNERVRQLKKSESENSELISALRSQSRQKENEINLKFDLQRTAQKRELAQHELDLERDKQNALLEIQKSQAVTPKDRLAVRLIEIKNENDQELRALDKAKNDKIAILHEEVLQRKITSEEASQEIAAIQDTANTETLARIAKTSQEIIAATALFNQQKLQQITDQKQLEIEAAGSPSEKLQAQLNLLSAQQDLEVQSAKDSIKTAEEKAATIAAIEKKYAKLRAQTQEEHTRGELAAISGFYGTLKGLFKENSAQNKAFASAQAIIDTYAAATAALKSGSEISPVFGIISAAAAVAAGLANVAKINSTNASFYEGGYTGDGDPRSTSTAVGNKPYTYHKREYVVDHKTLQNPVVRDLIYNVVEGKGRTRAALTASTTRTPIPTGRSYASGGFADSFAIAQIAQAGMSAEDIQNIVKSTIEQFPPIVTYVQDVTEKQGVVNKVESRANH